MLSRVPDHAEASLDATPAETPVALRHVYARAMPGGSGCVLMLRSLRKAADNDRGKRILVEGARVRQLSTGTRGIRRELSDARG
jgi:hypothetical protein